MLSGEQDPTLGPYDIGAGFCAKLPGVLCTLRGLII